MDSFIFEKKALNSKDCKKIIRLFEKEEQFHHPGVVGANYEVDIKRKECTEYGYSFDLNVIGTGLPSNQEIPAIIHKGICSVVPEYKKKFPFLDALAQWNVSYRFNLQKYMPGQGYHILHCEADSPKVSNRMMAWMIYLNDVTEGGETYFPYQNKYTQAEEGKFVLWPAYWTHPHKGIVSKTQTKYIATGWFNFVI